MISQNRIAALDEQPASSPAGAEDVSATQVFEAIWRHRWALVVMPIVMLAIAAVYLAKAEKLYSSNSRIYVQQNGPRILNDSQGVSSYSSDFLTTQCEFIQSTPILANAIELGNLAKLKSFKGIDNEVGAIKSRLDTEVQKNTEIISISFQSPYPEEAGQVVNAIVNAYVQYQASQKRDTAGEVLKILEEEKEKQEKELDAKQKELLAFKRQNGMLSFQTDGGNIVTQRLAALSQAMTEAEFSVIEAKAVASAAKNLSNDPEKLRQFIDNQSKGVTINVAGGQSNPEADELARLARQVTQLSRTYGPQHHLVQDTLAEMDYVRKQAAKAQQLSLADYQAALQEKVTFNEQRYEELKKAYQDQRTAALDLNTQTAEYARLDGDVKRIERLDDILDTRIKELNVTQDDRVPTTNIIETAKSGMLVWPRPDQVLAVALTFGFLLGIGAALGLDFFDQRLRSVEEIRRALDVQIMGVVPHIGIKETASTRGQKVALEPMSNVAEAYRTLRTALYFSSSRNGGKKVLVTSPAPGDGKTTTASNLAIAIAQAGQRTLLIDADLRKPMQHRIFKLENNRGLVDVLTKRDPVETVIHKTNIENLEVLTCGPLPPNPAEVLNSQHFRDLLLALENRYDHVIIDSPPVAPVTDARILGGICDQTLLVLRAEKSNRKLSAHAKEALQEVGADVIGVVVNDVPRGRERYGYYYGYGYSYGYGANGKKNGNGRRQDALNATPAAAATD